eukprot:gene16877-6806_t
MMKTCIRGLLLLLATPWANGLDCTYNGLDYSMLTNDDYDYSVVSELYSRNTLVWNDQTCYSGAGICERLVESKTGTEVYGIAGTSEWVTDSSKDYFHDTETSDYIRMTGGACLFGGNMEARIYQHCLVPNDTHKNDEPYAEILHESLWSTTACIAQPPANKKHRGEGGTLATLGILVFVGMAAYFGIGGYVKHKRGVTGMDRIPHKEFWTGIPGLAKDGLIFTKMKIKDVKEKNSNGTAESSVTTPLFV